ncbi:hypothetical protein HPP92_003056 [Vanilla planifolia]|uniref:Uncharacterized protein n=1 Tax=Vanilla planifolia TaxID=51239 RepID=A0A835RTP4_VANPL|nr:hypothetical protein HPP92_003056 [Vanilla planifolia]
MRVTRYAPTGPVLLTWPYLSGRQLTLVPGVLSIFANTWVPRPLNARRVAQTVFRSGQGSGNWRGERRSLGFTKLAVRIFCHVESSGTWFREAPKAPPLVLPNVARR